VFFEGAVYYVYNRVARGERLFRDEGEYRSRLENVDRAVTSASAEVS